ncbi:mitogen-activated protein kinase kinase kinase 7-like [Papaver somniferum]|uniref:mitogen-activated protein kinase kinase kinase 7-like n=1 Tax=Papaver somniferum TaxID=3469 RepID=UPI000E705682|nr:mitogen-activated protein kinase kinase kinase 7-like [Papaver somniferum]
MDQFRHLGKVLGYLKALMVFKDDIQINQRQCCLLVDVYTLAYEVIAEEIKKNLRFEERHTKWKAIESPLKELHRIYKEGAHYIQQCLEIKDWWAKAISLEKNTDCIEFHIHNFLSCIPVVIEAIEIAGEIAGCDHDEIHKKRVIISNKYDKDWRDPKLFQWKYGRQYLVSQDICNRLDTVWREDRWFLLQTIREMKSSTNLSKQEQRLAEILIRKLDDTEPEALFHSSFLVGSKDFQVRRRLGNGSSQYKEIQWLGESFAVRQFYGNIDKLIPNISLLLSITHPNVMHFPWGFSDEDKKENFLVMELMNKDLFSYIKEISGPRKRFIFSLPVAVDLMLQIARGMEYLHSQKIHHGDLNPYNVLVRTRNPLSDGYLHAKVSGFGLSSIKNFNVRTPTTPQETHPHIWYAPEVLSEQEHSGDNCAFQYSEKADVYSFGMICYQLLTGKVPFEDLHGQGDKLSRNIRSGERPSFPFSPPRYITSLTKKCWHAEPLQRPSFTSICRILRYIKRLLLMNPDHSQPDAPSPVMDYCDIEQGLSKKFSEWGSHDPRVISQIPFQIFAYRGFEKERIIVNFRERSSESGSDGASLCGDENGGTLEDPFTQIAEMPTISYERTDPVLKKTFSAKKFMDGKISKPGTPSPRGRTRPPQLTIWGRNLNNESIMSPSRRKASGHSSDSDVM